MAGIVKDTSTFETGYDSWTTPVAGTVGFTRKSGATGSSSTGPSAAAAGSYYVYAETSSQYFKTFDMQKSFLAGSELYGVAFHYHMYGHTMGTARLRARHQHELLHRVSVRAYDELGYCTLLQSQMRILHSRVSGT